MRTFFLFYLLSWLLGNPLLALILVAALFYFGEARLSGRYFNPAKFVTKRQTIADLKRRLSINDHDVASHNDLGRLLADDGRFDQALPHLHRAVSRMEESAETNYYLGLAMMETGDSQAGIEHIEKALSINPRFLYGEPYLALARHHSVQGRHREALEEAMDAVSLNTSSIEGWVLVGKANSELGEQSAAADAFAEAKKAFAHLPRYLKLPNRRWLREAKREARKVRA